MQTATRRINNPKTPVKMKTSTERKTAIAISIFRYGSFTKKRENCSPMYFVMKNEHADAINTTISR